MFQGFAGARLEMFLCRCRGIRYILTGKALFIQQLALSLLTHSHKKLGHLVYPDFWL